MAITISGENNNDRILAQDGVIDQISGINIVGLITASHINVGSNINLGNAGIVTATTFVGNLTGNVNSTSPLLLQTGGSERFRITGDNALGIAGANYGSSGQVLTSGGSGSAVTWSAIPTQVTIANNADNRLITGGSGTNLNGEANLTFNGSILQVTGQGSFSSAITASTYIQGTSSNGGLKFYSDSSTSKGVVLNTDDHLVPSHDSNSDLGLTGTRWRNLYADTLYGDGSNLTGITQTTINNNADNRVITGTGSANVLNAESNVHVDGSGRLLVGTSTNNAHANADNAVISGTGNIGLSIMSTDSGRSSIYFGDSSSSPGSYAGFIDFVHSSNSFNIGRGNDNSLTIDSSGRLLIGTTTEGWTGYDELTIATSGNTGMTIRSGTSNTGAIAFADGTSGDAEYRGIIKYGHTDDDFFFCTNGDTTRMKVASNIIETGTKTITGGNNLAIQGFAVKGIYSGSPSIGKSIELISGYDSAVKMAAIGYNLTDVNLTGSSYGGDLTFHTQPLYGSPTTPLPVRMRISSKGQFVVGTDPTVNGGNIAHIEAPTSFNSGETIVQIVGDNAAAGARLGLQNKNTGGNTYNEILGTDAGGQSTSSIRFYNTDQSNNYGEIAFGTRSASGVPPVDRVKIHHDGEVEFITAGYEFTENNFRSTSTANDNSNTAQFTNAMTSLMGSFHGSNNTNGIMDFIDYKASDWTVLEVYGKVNPNVGGSGAYSDLFHMTIYKGAGYTHPNVVTTIFSVMHTPSARMMYSSGTSNNGNDGITAVWYDGSTESREFTYSNSNNAANYLRIKVPTSNFNTSNGMNFGCRIFKRF